MWGRRRRPFWPAAELGTSSSPHSWKRRTDTAAGPARARAKAGEYRAVLPSKWQCLEERLGSLGQLFTEDCVHCNTEEKPVGRCHTHVRYMRSSCKTQSKHICANFCGNICSAKNTANCCANIYGKICSAKNTAPYPSRPRPPHKHAFGKS